MVKDYSVSRYTFYAIRIKVAPWDMNPALIAQLSLCTEGGIFCCPSAVRRSKKFHEFFLVYVNNQMRWMWKLPNRRKLNSACNARALQDGCASAGQTTIGEACLRNLAMFHCSNVHVAGRSGRKRGGVPRPVLSLGNCYCHNRPVPKGIGRFFLLSARRIPRSFAPRMKAECR